MEGWVKGLFAFLTRERGCGGFGQLRDTTSRFCGLELPELGSPVIALSLFLQPKHGAFNNGLKTLSSSTQDHSTWLAFPPLLSSYTLLHLFLFYTSILRLVNNILLRILSSRVK